VLELSKPPIRPIYTQSEPSASIDLGITPVEFILDGTRYREDARVEMSFVPSEQLRFVIPHDSTSPPFGGVGHRLFQQRSITLSLPNHHGQSFDGFCIATDGDGTVLIPRSSVVTITPASNDISTAVFHLFNFPAFIGPEDYSLVTGQPPHQASRLCGCIILKADDWQITIAATDKTDDLVEALKDKGGYVITHMGKIEREDGSTFSSEQLADLLCCLHFFLSAALGRWAGVALPVGLNQNGDKVFEQWGTPRVAANQWHGSRSWFDEHHGGLLSEVFPGFFARWNEEAWAKPLRTTLYWYLAANDRGTGIGVDAGLILAQTALECLAWTYCVEDRKMVSRTAFLPRGLSASDKLRMLGSTLQIPMQIPPETTALHARYGAEWDIPDAITNIRNQLVHPSKKDTLPEGSYYEAWKLAMWLLDLVLLHLCSHTGKYANRLPSGRWVGVVSDVPWVNKAPSETKGKAQ
jgi:hypothetical protein